VREVNGDTLFLRPARVEDFPSLRALRGDPDLQHALLAYPPAKYQDDVESWVTRRQAGGAFLVIADATEACIGFAQIANLHRSGLHGDFGIALVPQARGRGVGRRATELLIAHAKNILKLHKLQLEVAALNSVAIHLYRKLGFQAVGTRHCHYHDGRNWQDVLVMELLLDDHLA
jgi:diamine N-acetyltransferase